MTTKATKLPGINEKTFQRQIEDLCKTFGWKYYHTFNSQFSVSGFPDLVMVRERVVYAELKSDTGKVSVKQQEWIDALRAAGEEAYIWFPKDFDEAARVLVQKGRKIA